MKPTDESLLAAIQQLRATEQQLRASNQQLEASNQQLEASNQQLRVMEQRYRSVFDQAAVGVARVGTDGSWLEVNDRLCAIVGYPREELLDKTFQNITHPDDLEADLDFIQRMLAGEIEAYSMEKRYVRKDGVIVWIDLTVSLVRDEWGEPLYFISVVQDISGRKTAEAELARSLDLLDATGRMARVGGWELDAATREVRWTDETYRIHEVSLGEKPSLEEAIDFFHPEDRERLARAVERALERGEPYNMELRFITARGNHRWTHTIGQPDVVDGRTVRLHGVFQDITERARAVRDLERIEWMLSSRGPEKLEDAAEPPYPPYGDLTELNRDGLILRAVGREQLATAAGDYLDLMDTSSAIYETSGEYAHGIFSSGWCRLLDRASRARCGCESDAEALASGRWLCHESCWTNCSRVAIATGEPVDIACNGGIRIYCEPIVAAGEVVGAINFGYGDPPRDSDELQRIAERYGVEVALLEREARRYATRPPYIVDLAKKRLRSTALLIGAFVESDLAGEESRRAEQRSRGMVEGLPIPTFIWQRVGEGFELNGFNKAAERVTAGGIRSLLGRPLHEMYTDEPGIIDDIERAWSQRMTHTRELEYRYRTTGKSSVLRVTYGYVAPDMVLVHTQDVTEQRRNEARLQTAHRLEAIGQLAGGIAHDFNNLLTVINGYSAFALEQIRQADPVRDDVEQISQAGDRAAALTRQLLAFGRKQIMQPRVLDLNAVVAGLEDMLTRLLGEDIDLTFSMKEGLGRVEADPSQLEQVVVNLAVNARDAMPEGGKLTIETSVLVSEGEIPEEGGSLDIAPGAYVVLAVSDTGTGMDRATRERVFEPFFTTKEKGKGTGLGLATVYGIVKQSGGNIWLYSEPGEGTTFKVCLPQVRSATEEAIAEAAQPTRSTGRETVLVVEDEDAVRGIVERILKSAGYRVMAASNGGEALMLCEQEGVDVDLLLTDVVMPKMSGKRLVERLETIRPGLKALYMSGYTDNAIVHHGVLDEDARFISKPFTAAKLTRKVREVLDE